MEAARARLDATVAWLLQRLIQLDSNYELTPNTTNRAVAAHAEDRIPELKGFAARLFQLRQGPLLAALQANVDDLLEQRAYLKVASVEQTVACVGPSLYAYVPGDGNEGRFVQVRAELVAFRVNRVLVLHTRDIIFVWTGAEAPEAELRRDSALDFARLLQRGQATALPPPSLHCLSGGSNLARYLGSRVIASFDLQRAELEELKNSGEAGRRDGGKLEVLRAGREQTLVEADGHTKELGEEGVALGPLAPTVARHLDGNSVAFVDYLMQMRQRALGDPKRNGRGGWNFFKRAAAKASGVGEA
uniref:Uncharacterized protein n=1 Tax=Phaeomonas parva TaxID=124430 RepID=A0A7S1UH84_9STRA